MGLPNVTSNYKGYAESDVYNKIEYLKHKMFYLVQGTADDNVQFQQSMALARHLTKKGILFRQQVTLLKYIQFWLTFETNCTIVTTIFRFIQMLVTVLPVSQVTCISQWPNFWTTVL